MAVALKSKQKNERLAERMRGWKKMRLQADSEGEMKRDDIMRPNERGPIVNHPMALSGRFVAYLVMAVHARNL
ncbi:hypothetical protein NDU88_004847 [Pleurodeles waltl]|uniref:Uncharacterized protein n=1 Tax=Pleurodeles waltl TaxID=8319 RepID=A0AAV7KYZ5_PLEWA|nr:hypothetical protein NDU88_004847 [Pleurodeles waltl]